MVTLNCIYICLVYKTHKRICKADVESTEAPIYLDIGQSHLRLPNCGSPELEVVSSNFTIFSVNICLRICLQQCKYILYFGDFGGPIAQVWRQRFWMMCYGSRTPKRSLLWSNSKRIGAFRTGKLHRQRLKIKRPPLVKQYEDGSGKKRFSGIRKNLKKSGNHALFQQRFHPINL